MRVKNLEMERDIRENYHAYDAGFFADKYKKSIKYIYSLASEMKVSRTSNIELDADEILRKYSSGVSLKKTKKRVW